MSDGGLYLASDIEVPETKCERAASGLPRMTETLRGHDCSQRTNCHRYEAID